MTLPIIGELEAIGVMFFWIFTASIVFGAVARKTEFCPLGGIADVIHSGNNGRLMMYLFAIGSAMLAVNLLEFFGYFDLDSTRPPYRMPQFRWLAFIIGGLFFGIGMTLCRGCGMKNMINLGSGNLKAIVAILGMGSAAVLMLYVENFFGNYFLSWILPLSPDLAEVGVDFQDLGSMANSLMGFELSNVRLVIALILGLFLYYIAFNSRDFTDRKANIIGGLLIGLLITAAYYISGGALGEAAQEASDFMDQPQNGMGTQSYTFIRPMGDLLYVMANPLSYLVTFGLVAFLGVGAGSVLMSIVTFQFKFEFFKSPMEAVRYLIGGIMVGVGGILGMGCTLGQGIAGTSTLAAGSFLNLICLIIGAVIGIKLQKHFMDDHEMPDGIYTQFVQPK